ncbi:MAG: EFR1 family ferrodoxin [Spirochaetales bacterium]|nr:EFR1 family ferrodoxin [Spirochaetales bacterium]
MAKILLAVFSQSGATISVAGRIEAGLKSSGHSVHTIPIEKGSLSELNEYDAVGIGTPVFFYRLPFLVSDFIRNLPLLKGKSAFWFCTYGTVPGKSFRQIHRLLSGKEAVVLDGFSCRGADYWYGYTKRGYLFNPESPTEEELFSAGVFSSEISRALENQVHSSPVPPDKTPLAYAVERMSMSRFNVQTFYSRTFRSKRVLCRECRSCVTACPNQNITFVKERPRWGTACIMCQKCAQSCPEGAIRSVADGLMFAPIMNFNIHDAKKRGIPYVHVEHRAGQTRVL